MWKCGGSCYYARQLTLIERHGGEQQPSWWWWLQIRRRGTWHGDTNPEVVTPLWVFTSPTSARCYWNVNWGEQFVQLLAFSAPLDQDHYWHGRRIISDYWAVTMQCAGVTVTIVHFIISDNCTTMAEVSVSCRASNGGSWRFQITEKASTGVIKDCPY